MKQMSFGKENSIFTREHRHTLEEEDDENEKGKEEEEGYFFARRVMEKAFSFLHFGRCFFSSSSCPPRVGQK